MAEMEMNFASDSEGLLAREQDEISVDVTSEDGQCLLQDDTDDDESDQELQIHLDKDDVLEPETEEPPRPPSKKTSESGVYKVSVHTPKEDSSRNLSLNTRMKGTAKRKMTKMKTSRPPWVDQRNKMKTLSPWVDQRSNKIVPTNIPGDMFRRSAFNRLSNVFPPAQGPTPQWFGRGRGRSLLSMPNLGIENVPASFIPVDVSGDLGDHRSAPADNDDIQILCEVKREEGAEMTTDPIVEDDVVFLQERQDGSDVVDLTSDEDDNDDNEVILLGEEQPVMNNGVLNVPCLVQATGMKLSDRLEEQDRQSRAQIYNRQPPIDPSLFKGKVNANLIATAIKNLTPEQSSWCFGNGRVVVILQNLPQSYTERTLRQMGSAFGTVRVASILRHKNMGKIMFKEESAAQQFEARFFGNLQNEFGRFVSIRRRKVKMSYPQPS